MQITGYGNEIRVPNSNNRSSKTKGQDTNGFSAALEAEKGVQSTRGMVLPGGEIIKNPYFIGARDGFKEYNGVKFRCNYKSGALELGDCSNPNKCLRVPLSGGGSLVCNPDSFSGLSQAFGMFSAEDQGRIMRAMKIFQMAQDKLEELEEDENAAPDEAAETDNEQDSAESIQRESGENGGASTFGGNEEKDYFAVLKERTEQYEIYHVRRNALM